MYFKIYPHFVTIRPTLRRDFKANCLDIRLIRLNFAYIRENKQFFAMSEHVMLSVIIPAYNVERTLARCIESVLMQQVEGMEVIVVDDGSTDATPAVADRYAGRRDMCIMHTANGGLSAARNAGLEHAAGRYVTFVDSDDYLMPGTYAPLLEMLESHPGYDIVEYSFDRDTPKGRVAVRLPEREYTDMAEYWLGGEGFSHTYAWNKIYRRRLFGDVAFSEGRLFEDVYAMGDMWSFVHTLRTTSRGTYRYTYNPKGITVRADARGWRDLLHGHLGIVRSRRLASHPAFPNYYAHLLNIQLMTYCCSGDMRDVKLPQMPYRHTWKLCLLQLLGMRRLCRFIRRARMLRERLTGGV